MTIFLFLGSVLFSLAHLAEELFGKGGPLWDNFGEIVNVKLPQKLGFLLFTVGLFLFLLAVSYGAYIAAIPWAISLLLGLRLGDFFISHQFLRATGLSDPNPGIYTSWLYFAEAAYLIVTMTVIQYWAVGAGILFFAGVLPLLWLAGKFVPTLRA